MSSTHNRFAPVVRLAFIAWFACMAVAIVIQNHTAALPFGVFNARNHQIKLISDAFLVAILAAWVVLVLEFSLRRSWALARTIRVAAFLAVFLDLGLRVADRLVMTGNATRGRGAHYEERLADGTPVIMRRSRGGMPVDFCDDTAGGFRLLFLGDSYTEGSGRDTDCNYVDVVEQELRLHWRNDTRVVNVGVNAHGPVDAANVLEWYREQGCPIDAVVYNLFLENDFTDNLPGTERRVVAGLAFRFPQSTFLKTFHPLNSWLLRWSMFAVHMAHLPGGGEQAGRLETGPCDPDEQNLGELTPFLRGLVENRLAGSVRVASVDLDSWPAIAAVRSMQETARSLGVPFILVIFPDRALVDIELQDQMRLTPDDLVAPREIHAKVLEIFGDVHVVDTTGILSDRVGLHRRSDTHLSDLGNQVVGRYVADALTGYLADVED